MAIWGEHNDFIMYRYSPTDSIVKTSALGCFSDGGQSAVLLKLSYPDSLAERETWSEATEQLELREVRTRAEPHRSPLLSSSVTGSCPRLSASTKQPLSQKRGHHLSLASLLFYFSYPIVKFY